jgi:hypothetical protein
MILNKNINLLQKLKFSINPDFLKIIAIISMTIDHLVKGIKGENMMLISNSAGRIAFPIFGFLIAVNLARFVKCDDESFFVIYKKYLIRLFIFGTITLYLDYLTLGKMRYNIMFTFFLSVLFIYTTELIRRQNFSDVQKILFISVSVLWFTQMSFLVEYSTQGFGYIVLFYYFIVYKEDTKYRPYFLVLLIIFSVLLNYNSILAICFTVSTVVMLLMIKKQSFEKKRLVRSWWFFYVYYPIHKTIINLIFH